MKRTFIYIVTAAVAFASCDGYRPEEILLPRNEISLTIKGVDQIIYDENTWQLGFNDKKNEFRVVDDKVSEWFLFRCETMPSSEGQKIKGDIEYTTDTDIKTQEGLTYSVEKISQDGLVWLWNDDKDIGAVIKIL
ncbi:MAG: hypothetical protein IKW27_01965 [Bacteroidales bacterium]|nr:hypothetical protein [Bacteroidales bacterium]